MKPCPGPIMLARWLPAALLLLATSGFASPGSAPPAAPGSAPPDTSESFQFSPLPSDSVAPPPAEEPVRDDNEREWLRPPFGDGLLTGIEPWHVTEHHHQDIDFLADYNRVDALRLGAGWRLHSSEPFMPSVGARIERAFNRNRYLYGAQFEQPLTSGGWLALGASMVRRTDHNDLQQTSDLENSLSMLFSKQDSRDYFEREGAGAYLSLRIPGVSTASFHVRSDQYRSLTARSDAESWFHDNRPQRVNPAIDDGESHSVLLRLERLTRRTRRTRTGLYHWIEIERSGHGAGGQFQYTRAIADLRSVLRLSPATSLSLRIAGGHTLDGTLPRQKEFTLGGPDVLRAHAVDAFRGDRLALAQAEYDVGLWHLRSHRQQGSLHALAFIDAGRAWHTAGPAYDIEHQKFAADAGVGLGTSENALRVYFAKNLQDLNHEGVFIVRLQRPF